jgi:hypothetical protein
MTRMHSFPSLATNGKGSCQQMLHPSARLEIRTDVQGLSVGRATRRHESTRNPAFLARLPLVGRGWALFASADVPGDDANDVRGLSETGNPGAAADEEAFHLHEDIENQIQDVVRGADMGAQNEEPRVSARRERARSRNTAKQLARGITNALSDDDDMQEQVSMHKILRNCERRVRTGGADAVRPAMKTLTAALADFETQDKARDSDYDMVITFCLRSWRQESAVMSQGLSTALDIMSMALSYGHAPSVRTFNRCAHHTFVSMDLLDV